MKGTQRQASATRLDGPGAYRIEIPEQVLEWTAVETGSDVSLSLAVENDRPRLVCTPASGGRAVTRRLSARSGESEPRLTLPKRCVEAGGFVGAHALPYADVDDDNLYVGLGRDSTLTAGSLVAAETAYLSAIRQGDLTVSLSSEVAGPLSAAERLYCSVDYYDGALFAVVDAAERLAPTGAIELTANPNTDREETAGLSFHFPRTLGRLCGFAGSQLRWGRTASGNRILGVRTDG